ncbi:Methyltransferase type 11 [Sergentomyia squamirostris]
MSFKNVINYYKLNNFTPATTSVLMEEYYQWIDWKKDDNLSLLDIGSGPGHTFRESVYPLIPENFSRIVLSDISAEMVEVEKMEFYGDHRVYCEVMDIGVEIPNDLRKRLGTFDHITSFFCLMWISDQQKAMDNIYGLLKPGGNAFLVLAADSPVVDAMLSVCESPKWKEHCIGWQDFYVYPYKNLKEAENKGINFMLRAGFTNVKAELRNHPFCFESDEEKERFLRGIPNYCTKNVPLEIQEQIFQDRLAHFDQFNLGPYRNNDKKVEKENTMLILFGEKEIE